MNNINRPFIAIDLELNQCSISKIIQLGMCVGDIYTGNIIETKSVYVNPNEQLLPRIIQLTGITQEQVDSGVTIQDAYAEFVALCQKHNVQSHGRVITWGHGDVEALRRELNVSVEDPTWILGRRYIDTKTIFQAWRMSTNEPIQSGLSKSMTKMGLKFEGKTHSADADAENTFRIYCELLKKFIK